MLCSIGCIALFLAGSIPAWSQDTPGEGVLLAQIHKSAGIACAQCHKQGPPSPVTTADCAGCHGDMSKTEVAPGEDALANPHNSHMPYPDCASCHHVHKPSENQCAGCHNFEFTIH